MSKLTKPARLVLEKVDATKEYEFNEAVTLLK
jgi:large subunit ribosomal protein L1